MGPGWLVAQTMSNPLIDTRQAAEALGMSPDTLALWRSKGEGPPFVKLGRAVRYRRADLDAWVAEQLCTSTAGPVAKPTRGRPRKAAGGVS